MIVRKVRSEGSGQRRRFCSHLPCRTGVETAHWLITGPDRTCASSTAASGLAPRLCRGRRRTCGGRKLPDFRVAGVGKVPVRGRSRCPRKSSREGFCRGSRAMDGRPGRARGLCRVPFGFRHAPPRGASLLPPAEIVDFELPFLQKVVGREKFVVRVA